MPKVVLGDESTYQCIIVDIPITGVYHERSYDYGYAEFQGLRFRVVEHGGPVAEWVEVPGTSMLIDKDQVISGKTRFTNDWISCRECYGHICQSCGDCHHASICPVSKPECGFLVQWFSHDFLQE